MKKLKPFSGKKRCQQGETYTFKKGVAVVPGMSFQRKPVKISLIEFNKLNKVTK